MITIIIQSDPDLKNENNNNDNNENSNIQMQLLFTNLIHYKNSIQIYLSTKQQGIQNMSLFRYFLRIFNSRIKFFRCPNNPEQDWLMEDIPLCVRSIFCLQMWGNSSSAESVGGWGGVLSASLPMKRVALENDYFY